MKSKKRTQIAVLRHTLGSYEGQEEVFAASVQCSVSWVKKASSGLRTITPKTARQVSLATGVSEKWLLVGDSDAPILERDDVTPYTRESYEGWRRDNLTASYSDQSESSLHARADMKLVVSGPFESGGFFRFAGDFSSPLRSKSFPFLCKKENMERPRATFMPVFSPHFQPAESIRVHAGPRIAGGGHRYSHR